MGLASYVLIYKKFYYGIKVVYIGMNQSSSRVNIICTDLLRGDKEFLVVFSLVLCIFLFFWFLYSSYKRYQNNGANAYTSYLLMYE
jgi:hypothetical protein